MTAINKSGSRLIEGPDGNVLVDSSDALLVEEVAVISKFGPETARQKLVVMEMTGRVNQTDEMTRALVLMHSEGVPEMIGLLMESLVKIDQQAAQDALVMAAKVFAGGDHD